MKNEEQRSLEEWLSDRRVAPLADLLDDYEAEAVSVARTNWYLGEWEELSKISLQQYRDHPDLAILATLKAAGFQQLGDIDQSKKYVAIARSLKLDPRLISAILIAGLNNSLGKIAATQGRTDAAKQYFLDSVSLGNNKSAASLASHTRTVKQLTSIGLMPELQKFSDLESKNASTLPSREFEKLQINYDALKQYVGSGVALTDENPQKKRPATVPIQDLLRQGREVDLVVAGMRHSGSTALYNLLRLSLISMGMEFEAGYSEVTWLEKNKRKQQLRLIKIHEVRDDLFRDDAIVITTIRDLRNTVASATRRGFGMLKKLGAIEYAKYNRGVHESWTQRSNYEFVYESFKEDPEEAISRLLRFLAIESVDAAALAAEVKNLPTDDYETTLLTPAHITDPLGTLSFTDTLTEIDAAKITRQNYKWLLKNGYV